MKQINDLVVIQVPRHSTGHTIRQVAVGEYVEWKVKGATAFDRLPIPCEIIGMASEIGIFDTVTVLNAADISIGNIYEPYNRLIQEHSLTNPQSDYLFLKRKV